MAKTERAGYDFSVKDCPDGSRFIILVPLKDNIKLLENGFLAFDLPDSTNERKAYEIAEFMSENLKSLAYTSLP